MRRKRPYEQSMFYHLSRLKVPLTYLMALLLVWLLNINYVIYKDNVINDLVSELMIEEIPESSFPNTNPAGPDEKSPNGPFSFSEEYIHEGELMIHNHLIDEIYLHKIHATELIELFHFELWSPPPELA
ncbi:hypothetical protein [Gynurincola endophyticus]|uniref:hypothetical protein n=1 Tax=Gynurincola endophyticus TaxID=2479004 RepID=UPI000F8D44E5|nr:hypothetical protein [Gynurincola endophyticus]